MKVLIADRFEQSGIDGLEAAGCAVLYQPDLEGAALAEAIRTSGSEVLVVRGTNVNAAALDAGQLALVVRAGAGYNTIDVAAASRRGIYVCNCPGRNAIAVAELTFALILALDRRVPDNVADLRAGRWNKKEYSRARGLFGRTLGLIGFGHIAAEVARRAEAFGMAVTVWSRRFEGGHADEAGRFTVARSLDQLAAESEGRYRIAKLNVDDNKQTASRFQIASIPTMLIFKDGKLIDRLIGAQSKPAIAERLRVASRFAA